MHQLRRRTTCTYIHPSHPDFPPTWLTRHYGCLCVGWPGVAGGSWRDRVFLSEQPVLEASDNHYWDLGEFGSLKPLYLGEYYTNTQTILLNPAAKGLYVIVQIDIEDLDTTNNEACAASTVTDRVPDLVVSSVITAEQAYSGDKTTVRYTVTNASDHPIWPGTHGLSQTRLLFDRAIDSYLRWPINARAPNAANHLDTLLGCLPRLLRRYAITPPTIIAISNGRKTISRLCPSHTYISCTLYGIKINSSGVNSST